MKILLGAAIGAIALTAAASAADKMHPIAHAHIGHVASGWTDTPKGMGLLPTALAEAKIAAYHAGVALTKPGNLAWLLALTDLLVQDGQVEEAGRIVANIDRAIPDPSSLAEPLQARLQDVRAKLAAKRLQGAE